MSRLPLAVTQPENTSIGIVCMLLTMLFFVILDVAAKYLMQHYSIVQVLWGRFFFHILFVLVYICASRPADLISQRLPLQISRSILMLTTTALFFVGISTIQLATASTIMFLTPILVTVLAIPLLGETVRVRRWVGVLAGFSGALTVVRPGIDQIEAGIVFLLAAALSNSFYQINTRQIRTHDNPMTSLLYTGLTGAIVTSCLVPFNWQWPDLEHWLIFIMLGITGSISHLCLIRAFRVAPASIVAPFGYTSLIWSVGFGFIIFDDLPDRWTIIGAVIIISSGLYIYHREQKTAQSA